MLAAFGVDGVDDAPFALPEFGQDVTVVPGETAMGFHFVDYVVHGWDVAATLGMPFTLPDDVVAAVLPLVMAVPDGEFRDAAAAPFARRLRRPRAATSRASWGTSDGGRTGHRSPPWHNASANRFDR